MAQPIDSRDPVVEALTLDRGVTGGTVIGVDEAGEIEVELTGQPGRVIRCDMLETSPVRGLTYRRGDRVLVMFPEREGELGCVLGRRRPATVEEVRGEATLLEVEHPVRIRSGAAQIDLSPDGRVSVQGRDVVTRAKRRNRIKGGSVQIN